MHPAGNELLSSFPGTFKPVVGSAFFTFQRQGASVKQFHVLSQRIYKVYDIQVTPYFAITTNLPELLCYYCNLFIRNIYVPIFKCQSHKMVKHTQTIRIV